MQLVPKAEFSIVTRANKAWIPELIAAAGPEVTETYIAFFHCHDPQSEHSGCLRSGLLAVRFEYQMQGSFGRYSSFGHAKTRPGGIWRDGFEELNGIAPYDRLLPLGERPTQFYQGDILQLPESALWSLRSSFQLLREFSVCRRPTRIA